VRDLYKKVKLVLSQENSERIFGLKDTKLLLDLHSNIDKKFDAMLTNNLETDQLFMRANMDKSTTKHFGWSALDLRQALSVHSNNSNKNEVSIRKRDSKRRAKELIKFRPHNFEQS
jgi:hypothetical protein